MMASVARDHTHIAASNNVLGVNIFEELLLALMGHTGDVFRNLSSPEDTGTIDQNKCSFKTSSELHFITAPQR